MPTLPIEDGTLWYEDRGEGPPLVCLHGGWQTADAWDRQVDRFADDYRVVRADLRGHGRTGGTGTRRYSVDLFADDVERLLSHLDVERPILVGLSLGGMVVQSYLDRHADAVRGAVVAGPLQSMPPVDLPRSAKPFLSPVPLVAGMLSTMGPTPTFATLLSGIRATTGRTWLTLDPAVRSATLDAVGDVSTAEFLKVFRALYRYAPPDLSHVGSPTLVVAGDHEAPQVARQGRRLAETVERGSFESIADAGHLVNEDAPAAFNAACERLFDALAGDDAASSPPSA